MTKPLSKSPSDPSAAAAKPEVLKVDRIRKDFPILQSQAHGKPLVYLDNAATTQKPQVVIDALNHYYSAQNANIHRGVYTLSDLATRLYEQARVRVRKFINAARAQEIIFTRGATESINLVAQTFGRQTLKAGDQIILSGMEHHSNIVPWQMLCQQTGATIGVIPFNDRGELLVEEYRRLLSDRTRLVAIVHVSNALGTINPVRQMIELAHERGVPVLVDGAQWVAHGATDVQVLDCDFYAFSAHKLYGPTGIGVLYGKSRHLEAMPPWQGGGDMIESVSFAKTTYAAAPAKFEAGTPHIAGAVGLAAAIDYVTNIGFDRIAAHEADLLAYASQGIAHLPGVRPIGTAEHKGAVLSFVVDDPPMSAQDVGQMLDLEGVAVRTGHHCCQPIMDRMGIPATVRASFALYNTRQEVDVFLAALGKVRTEAARRKKVVLAPSAAYPEATAPSPRQAGQDLLEVFEFLEDWNARYQYIIELGEKLAPMPAGMKTEANRVHGCQSTVHLSARQHPGSPQLMEFLADSDADIVRGLIALLQRLFSGQKASEILEFNVEEFFAGLGLDQHLSMTRRNGLHGMVKRIRALASEMVPSQSPPSTGATE